MHRLHLDDIRDSMPHGHFAFLKQWLRRSGTIIVKPDVVRVADNAMPGTFTTRPGRWGEDEPYSPYGGYRKLLEDARASPEET